VELVAGLTVCSAAKSAAIADRTRQFAQSGLGQLSLHPPLMLKAVINGRSNEIVELANTNSLVPRRIGNADRSSSLVAPAGA
jgi:hypothetical protein